MTRYLLYLFVVDISYNPHMWQLPLLSRLLSRLQLTKISRCGEETAARGGQTWIHRCSSGSYEIAMQL